MFFFLLLGGLAIASGIVTISSKNPLASAVSLVFHFFMLAGLYLTLQAQFVAVIQILVYAGAIMVLVIFVIMLLNLGDEKILKDKFNYRKVLAVVVAGALALQLVVAYFANSSGKSAFPSIAGINGTAEAIGMKLFNNYLFPFEITSILLLLAIVGAIVLAKRRLD